MSQFALIIHACVFSRFIFKLTGLGDLAGVLVSSIFFGKNVWCKSFFFAKI